MFTVLIFVIVIICWVAFLEMCKCAKVQKWKSKYFDLNCNIVWVFTTMFVAAFSVMQERWWELGVRLRRCKKHALLWESLTDDHIVNKQYFMQIYFHCWNCEIHPNVFFNFWLLTKSLWMERKGQNLHFYLNMYKCIPYFTVQFCSRLPNKVRIVFQS